MMHFFASCRDLFHGTTINDMHLVGCILRKELLQPDTASRGIHCHVTGPDNGNLFPNLRRSIVFREEIALHQIDPCKKFVGGHDPVKIDTGYAHEGWQASASA